MPPFYIGNHAFKKLESEDFVMQENTEKRIIAGTGYEVIQEIHIGDKEILVAEKPNELRNGRYLIVDYIEKFPLCEYCNCEASNDYLEIMQEYTKRLSRQIEVVRSGIAPADFQVEVIAADKCYLLEHDQNIEGKVVAVKAEALRREYQRGDRQLILVTGGFGAQGCASGNAVYCYQLYNGKNARYERYDILGEIKQLPQWAEKRLEMIKTANEAERKQKKKDKGAR